MAMINGKDIKYVAETKFLGLWETLNWKSHIGNPTTKLSET